VLPTKKQIYIWKKYQTVWYPTLGAEFVVDCWTV